MKRSRQEPGHFTHSPIRLTEHITLAGDDAPPDIPKASIDG
jgi:hypothetical protein